jgi:hypothetical protein
MNAEKQALLQRWAGFCAKLEGRLDALIVEAKQGVDALAQQYPTDTQPLGNAMSGLDGRISQLRDKIDETWDGSVEEKFDEAIENDEDNDDDGFLDMGLDAKRDFEIKFDEKWDLWKASAVAEYHRKMWPHVEEGLKKPIFCTQCGAQLANPGQAQTASINCSHCGAVVQVVPEQAVMIYYGGGAAHAFGEERALPIRYQIERFREDVDRWRRAREWANETVESMEKWEALELSFWRTYAEAKGEMLGQPVDEELIESRMRDFRKYNLENDQRWCKAKGL